MVVAEDAKPQAGALWSNDFEKLDVGAEPPNAIASDSPFTVQKESDTNKVLELPGAPLENMVLTLSPGRAKNVAISARVKGEKKGRLYPSFGVGLCGLSGFRLIVSPMRDSLELMRGDEVIQKIAFKWEPATWTKMKLTVVKTGEKEWTIRGKAWKESESEPGAWTVELKVTEEPPSGSATLWGMPYSGKPIWYDDVVYGEETK